jgi:hypothetical protein
MQSAGADEPLPNRDIEFPGYLTHSHGVHGEGFQRFPRTAGSSMLRVLRSSSTRRRFISV